MRYPWALDYWQSGEWQVVNERLHDLEKRNVGFNPTRANLFKALQVTPEAEVRAVIMGQDPYPTAGHATGVAFSIPTSYEQSEFPPTLRQFFSEYCSDLSLPMPDRGDLTSWSKQGVLLWNAIPSCTTNSSLSHDWYGNEWAGLTSEICRRLSRRGIVFALLGGVARRHLADIELENNEVILTSHPSPRGNMNSKTPFKGSRLFSTINDKLNGLGLEPIDWRLPDGDQEQSADRDPHRRDAGDGVGTVLINETGSSCGPLRDARGVEVRS